jgi:hypothetical protein
MVERVVGSVGDICRRGDADVNGVRVTAGRPVKSMPRVKVWSLGASMWIMPLVACVCSGEKKLSSSRPMLAATGSARPFTRMSR